MDRESVVRGLHEPKRAMLRFRSTEPPTWDIWPSGRGGVQASAEYREVKCEVQAKYSAVGREIEVQSLATVQSGVKESTGEVPSKVRGGKRI